MSGRLENPTTQFDWFLKPCPFRFKVQRLGFKPSEYLEANADRLKAISGALKGLTFSEADLLLELVSKDIAHNIGQRII